MIECWVLGFGIWGARDQEEHTFFPSAWKNAQVSMAFLGEINWILELEIGVEDWNWILELDT